MKRYLIRKLATLLTLLLVVTLVVFTALFVLPGDPAEVMLGINATDESLAALRAQLGLDRPFLIQYGDWLWSMIGGRSAQSIVYDLPVFQLMGQRLAVTGPLALLALLVAVVVGLPAGVFAARRQGRFADVAVAGSTQIGLAIPEFWLGILLILLLSLHWPVFPAGGFPGWKENFGGSLRSLVLPAISLGLIRAAILTRLTRAAVLDVLSEDYVRTARAKGLGERAVLWGHVLKNALIPVLTVFGLQLGQLLAGALVIENVFFLPGLGRLLFEAIGQRDLPVVREVVVCLAAVVVVVNYLVDISYAALDPRIRMEF